MPNPPKQYSLTINKLLSERTLYFSVHKSPRPNNSRRMSCDTSPQSTSSPPIKFRTAAFTCSSPSCGKRKRELEGDEVRLHSLRCHEKIFGQNEGINDCTPEIISEKLEDERGLCSNTLPPITCSPRSMAMMRGPQDKDYLHNSHPRKGYLSQMMASGLNGSFVKDFFIGNLTESTTSLESMCDKRDDELSSVASRKSDSPRCNTTDETISYSKPPHQSDKNPEIIQVPRSPSDRSQTKDLRRAALLRSIKIQVLPFGKDDEREDYVVRTSQDNTAAAARSRLNVETLDGFLSQKCHL